MRENTAHETTSAGMRRIATLLLITCFLALPSCDRDTKLTEREIAVAAETWVRHVTAEARPDAAIDRMEPYRPQGRTVAHIAHLAGGGFSLCGASELLLPVYLYCPKGTYDAENLHLQQVLEEIEAREELLTRWSREDESKLERYRGTLKERGKLWQDLIAREIPAEVPWDDAPAAMELDLTAKWDNGNSKPPPDQPTFNAHCPELPGTGEHSRVGCNATAMSQIMYYWKWPVTGQGLGNIDFHYRWWDDGNEVAFSHDPFAAGDETEANWPWAGRLEWIEEDGNLRIYGQWDDGHLDSDGDFSTQSLLARAKKIPAGDWEHRDDYHNALDGIYGNPDHQDAQLYKVNFGATSYLWDLMAEEWNDNLTSDEKDAMSTLAFHAGVASETEYGVKASGSGTQKVRDALADHFRYDADLTIGSADPDVMREEIQWLRPMIMRGTKPGGGGHFWVVYGYKLGTHQFKMNMGWGADTSGCWYTLDGTLVDDLEYTDVQEVITHMAPKDVVRFVGYSGSGDGSPDHPYGSLEEALADPTLPENATLIFKAGSVNTFSANELTFPRPMTLKGHDLDIRKE